MAGKSSITGLFASAAGCTQTRTLKPFTQIQVMKAPSSARQKLLKEIQVYKAQLESKSDKELQELRNREYEKDVREKGTIGGQQEVDALLQQIKDKSRFFDQPGTQADFTHWSKAAHWTLDEAIALSFGKEPKVVNWGALKAFVKISPFAKQYEKTRDLALRTKQWGQLFDPVLPGIFLAWAKRIEIDCSPELEKLITARGHQIADWQSLCEKSEALSNDKDDLIKTLNEQKDALRQKIAELEAIIASPPVVEKTLLTKERESLLKLVIGMAIEQYNYDPHASRSPVAQTISDDLAQSDLSLDPDTVRKWLRAGAEILP